jgi:cysteinyl-tRNA synthetase
MNITDVGHLTGDDDSGEDKMVKSAEEMRKSVLEVAAFYTEAFFHDTEMLNIVRPVTVCKATEHIDDMIALIKKIEAAGFTYSAGGNLYFDITKFPHYGELALLKQDECSNEFPAGARVDLDENKKNPHDFVLWFTKSKFENQALVWDSPWGRGYPGWHIECSAMSSRYLGEQFDIHAGGIDHIPIHHTNEIAQSEAATAKHPWVRYWIHNEFLVLDKGKMSKSAGGFITLKTLVDAGYSGLDYRYFLLTAHYRSQIRFSFEALDSAKASLCALTERIASLSAKRGAFVSAVPRALRAAATATSDATRISSDLSPQASKYLAAFNTALDDDLSTPRALAALWGLLRDKDVEPLEALGAAFRMDRVLGLKLEEAATEARARKDGGDKAVDAELAAWVEERIACRAEAKKAKNYARADEIRNELKERGIILEDSKDGVKWKMQNC